jgi:hypothetical protein
MASLFENHADVFSLHSTRGLMFSLPSIQRRIVTYRGIHTAWKHNLFTRNFIYVTGLCVYLRLIKSVDLCSLNVSRKSTTTGSF